MKLLMISGLTVLALVAVATSMPRSHPLSAGHTSVAVQELQKLAQHSRLAVEDFEDRSLVFPRGTQR
jgi:hypothetical protein